MNLTLISSQPWIIHRWIILTPSSQLTSEIWRGCEYYNLKWPSRTILLNDSLEWFSCHAIGCWWFVRRFFKYRRCIFSQRRHAVPRFILLSKQCYCNWEEYDSLRTVLHENDLELFCVISPYEFRICWKSCWKVDKFLTIEQERRSTDAWIFFNFYQPNTNDNSPSLRNCWVFFYLLFFVSLFLLHQSSTDLFL